MGDRSNISSVNHPPRRRNVSRALVVDPTGSLLLARHDMSADLADQKTIWLVPGGGVEPGETLAEAARREVFEETGLRDVEVGPPLAVRRRAYRWKQETIDAVAYYHRVCHPRFEPSPQALSTTERETFVAFDWVEPSALPDLPGIVVPPELLEISGSKRPLKLVGDWAHRALFATIGHSNRSRDDFIDLLTMHDVRCVADVRTAPYSRRFPWFRRDELRSALAAAGIAYEHVPELGGRRPTPEFSSAWSGLEDEWWGYVAHMQTAEFETGLSNLEQLARDHGLVAAMCAERLPQDCHRQFMSDALIRRGHAVVHIADRDVLKPHFAHPSLDDERLLYPSAQTTLL